jgi:caffeoyl-CoA O-methyltransferase
MLGLLTPRDPVLARIETEVERGEVPAIGPHVGRLLARVARARANIAEARLGERIEVLQEGAMDYLERGGEPVDALFNDLLNSFPDEATVERCFELSLARLRPGGLLLADNALGRGRVIAAESRPARNIDRYNHLVAADPRLEGVIVPIRDGLSLARLT